MEKYDQAWFDSNPPSAPFTCQYSRSRLTSSCILRICMLQDAHQYIKFIAIDPNVAEGQKNPEPCNTENTSKLVPILQKTGDNYFATYRWFGLYVFYKAFRYWLQMEMVHAHTSISQLYPQCWLYSEYSLFSYFDSRVGTSGYHPTNYLSQNCELSWSL